MKADLTHYFARHPGVAAAYLFGSHATGRGGAASDIDVAILLDWGRYPP